MLTQGPAPDPKCKLIISSFLTLPYLLDCLICTRNAMPIVLLLQMLGGWDRWGGGGLIYIRVWMGGQGWVLSYSFCCFFSCAFVFCFTFSVPLFRWLEHDGCCVFFCFFFIFFVSGPFKLLCLLYKTILKVSYPIIILWISLEKGECFDFNHSLGCVYPTLYIIRLLCRVYHFSLLLCYPSSYDLYYFKKVAHSLHVPFNLDIRNLTFCPLIDPTVQLSKYFMI